MTPNDATYEGSCFCGTVRYRVRGRIGPMDHCHCTDCRKSHAAAFATYIEVPLKGFEFLAGGDRLTTYAAATGTSRSFCRTCGSIITCRWNEKGREGLEISASTLDTPCGLRPEAHTFVRSKAEWLDLADDLPRHEKHKTP